MTGGSSAVVHKITGSLYRPDSPAETGRQSLSRTTGTREQTLPTGLPATAATTRVATAGEENLAEHIDLLRSHVSISPFGSTDAHGALIVSGLGLQ
jgi:hypothetical protein